MDFVPIEPEDPAADQQAEALETFIRYFIDEEDEEAFQLRRKSWN